MKIHIGHYDSMRLWQVKGDEELAEYNFKSRTAAPDWGYLQQTPSIFRFSWKPEPVTEYKVNIQPLDFHIRRLNDNHPNKMARLYSVGTALFNSSDGFDWMMLYATMSSNILKGIEVVNNQYLKFETVKPTDDVSRTTRASHPWLVQRWDLVTMQNGMTAHVIDRYGEIYWFLCSKEGFGYIPLKYVKPYHGQ